MIIRKASSEDMEKLVDIRLEYLVLDFSVTEEQEKNLREELPDYYARHLGTDFHAYIAEDEGEIVASVFLVIQELPANTNFITGKIGNVLNVYTKPEYRKQGIAKRLLNNMIEEAKRENLSYLELIATEDGYPVYKKLGFTERVYRMKPMQLTLT